MQNRIRRVLDSLFVCGILVMANTQSAWAEAGSEEDLRIFLQSLGDFLIRSVGPGILVIGIAIAGVSMALGDEQGMRRGALAAGGGALIMLSRAVLALIQNVTHF